MDRDILIPLDGSISIRARRLKQVCKVGGKNLAQQANKEERARKIEGFTARIRSNHCIFSDETVRPGTFDLKLD